MSAVDTKSPITLGYKSSPTVHQFRPVLLTIIAVVGTIIATADLGMQIWIWYQQLRSQYPRINEGSGGADALAYLIQILAFGNALVLFGSSLCLLSLRPWVRWGLLIYAVAGAVMILALIYPASSARTHLIPEEGLLRGVVMSTTLQHPLMIYVSWFNSTVAFVTVGALILVHLVVAGVAMFLPATKVALEKGKEYLHTAYTSVVGR